MGFVDAHMTFGHETMNGLTEKNLIFLFYFFVFNPPSTWCFPFNSSRTCRMVAIKVSLMLSPEPKVSPWINHRGITVSLKNGTTFYVLIWMLMLGTIMTKQQRQLKAFGIVPVFL